MYCQIYYYMFDLLSEYLLHVHDCVLYFYLLTGDVERHPGPRKFCNTSDSEHTLSIYHHNHIRSIRNKIDAVSHTIEDFDIIFFTVMTCFNLGVILLTDSIDNIF